MNSHHLQYQYKSERLADAFRVFNELSENLSASYQALQEQVAHLNRRLEDAQNERLATLVEKEKLANRFEQILLALPAAVIVLNAQGRVIDCNERAVRFLGEPLIGLQWPSIMQRSLSPIADSPHEHRLRDGRIVGMTRNQMSHHGEQIILLSDVTELRTLQDSLAQQKHLSAMGEMVASLAHQIRTPLATAILYASQMVSPSLSALKAQQFSGKILERLHYLERQVNDMLMFAKQGRLAMQGFSCSSMLSHVAERMDDFAGAFGIDNQVGTDRVWGNEDALRGALLNLLNNAIEAGATVISLVAEQYEQTVTIAVRDNGPGIANDVQKQLFQPFFTTKAHGTGLGLAVVDSVVKAHQGHIRCWSELGQGTVFEMVLPILPDGLGLSQTGPVQALLEENNETL
ncbi:MAG: sensor histidine kinase [Gammaproteobacteria bacterium]